MRIGVKQWFASGSPWIWLNGAAVAISVIMVVGLLALIAVRGLGHFWPAAVLQAEVSVSGQPTALIGSVADEEVVSADQLRDSGVILAAGQDSAKRLLIKAGNRDVTGADFVWVLEQDLRDITYPEDIITLERREWGNFYGRVVAVKEAGSVIAQRDSQTDAAIWRLLLQRVERSLAIYDDIYEIEKGAIGQINYGMERLRLRQRGLELKGQLTPVAQAELDAERDLLNQRYEGLQQQLVDLYTAFERDSMIGETMSGQQLEINLSKIVRAFRANAMTGPQKVSFYASKLWEFVSAEPREANTEGGVFPAIFGTVMMVLLMSVMVTPFGVVAAVYLREYARQGPITRIIRIAVNNLAGVPSIVYGVFGLGFFIYFLGGNIDQLFFPEAAPAPTFGTPGLLWASLTLALLTVPVVIVATEEGLSRIPRAVREGSLALGATKAETLWRVVLPMASPAMMTGVILAVARAAGEVAPLMLVGVVKLAPSLPLDGNYPYLHLDQKFMHLGFHIYDVGFQSPNVEAARPLVYATALLLVLVIALLNLSAVAIRNRLREKYKALES
ncbi:MAG TPA: phosphate ABC transporter permease PtsA [Oceanospirillaceae bacterium]|nr:phosphate ABC transporter permease PtsA [Oceanospirillaceae bacterium]